MELQKNIKDVVYRLLNEPTLENFREFLTQQTGEHNSVDFKKIWIEKNVLAKEILSIANSGGGFIIFGVQENADKTFEPIGLDNLKGKEQVSNEIKNIISSNLKYEIHDFQYSVSEYEKLKDKKFQILVVEDTPEYLPFISKKEAGSEGDGKIIDGLIYIRKGTSCEKADEEDVQRLIKRRLEYMYPSNGEPLELQEHLKQLQVLYNNVEPYKYELQGGIVTALSTFAKWGESIVGKQKKTENPLYPEESYEEYISRLITIKKKKIERVLELN